MLLQVPQAAESGRRFEFCDHRAEKALDDSRAAPEWHVIRQNCRVGLSKSQVYEAYRDMLRLPSSMTPEIVEAMDEDKAKKK